MEVLGFLIKGKIKTNGIFLVKTDRSQKNKTKSYKNAIKYKSIIYAYKITCRLNEAGNKISDVGSSKNPKTTVL